VVRIVIVRSGWVGDAILVLRGWVSVHACCQRHWLTDCTWAGSLEHCERCPPKAGAEAGK
jgi:hypothetical protein